MHSRREVSRGEWVCVQGCVRGGLLRGVYTSPLWTEFLTHACENITFFPQLLSDGNNSVVDHTDFDQLPFFLISVTIRETG